MSNVRRVHVSCERNVKNGMHCIGTCAKGVKLSPVEINIFKTHLAAEFGSVSEEFHIGHLRQNRDNFLAYLFLPASTSPQKMWQLMGKLVEVLKKCDLTDEARVTANRALKIVH